MDSEAIFKLIQTIIKNKYIIIWWHAVNFHWYARHTCDLDMMINLSNDWYKKLEKLLIENKVKYEIVYIPPMDFSEEIWTIMRIPIFHGYYELIQAKYNYQIDAIKKGVKSWDKNYINKYYLLLFKIAAWWTKDIIDINHLIISKKINITYLKKIIKKYNFHTRFPNQVKMLFNLLLQNNVIKK